MPVALRIVIFIAVLGVLALVGRLPGSGTEATPPAELLRPLPAGYSYQPLPAEVEQMLTSSGMTSLEGLESFEGRIVVQGDRTSGIVLALAAEAEVDAGDFRAGFDSNAREPAREATIGGAEVLVGRSADGSPVAMRIEERNITVLYAMDEASRDAIGAALFAD